MSGIGDAFSALKNVILLHERIDAIQKDITRLNADVRGLNDYSVGLDKRLVRIETMVEMTRSGNGLPRIEG